MRFATWNDRLERYELYELEHDRPPVYFKYNCFNPTQAVWLTEGTVGVEDAWTGEVHEEQGEIFASVSFPVKLKNGPLDGMVSLRWLDNGIKGDGANEVIMLARWAGGRYVIRGGMGEYRLEHVNKKGEVEHISGVDSVNNLFYKAMKDTYERTRHEPDTCK